MKKILAIVLVLAMLIPLGVTAQAEGVAEKPFYYVNISQTVDSSPHTYQMLQFYAPPAPAQFGPGDEAIVSWGGTSDIVELAAAVKEEFDSRPDGTRYINFSPLSGRAFDAMANDLLFMEDAIEYVHKWLHEFLSEYKRIGGKLDGMSVDQEYENAESYYLYNRIYINDPTIYHRIVTNPMYQTKLRPALEERGFKFYHDVTEQTPEIYGIHPNAGDEYAQCRTIWDTVTRNLINEYATVEVYDVLVQYYPDANVMDYQSYNRYEWIKGTNNAGTISYGGGNLNQVGNYSCDNTYNYSPNISFYKNSKGVVYNSRSIPTYVNAVYADVPFNYLLWDINKFKTMYEASDNGDVSMWFTHYCYNEENPNSSSTTPYYTETVLHMAMLDPLFLGYTTPAQFNNDMDAYTYALEVIEDIMVELSRVAGYEDREPIHIPAAWNSSFVLSGIYANGRNLFRITPDTTQVSLENFKIDGTDPTFYVNGQTVTFPGGKIIADGNVREVGTCGYWVETPKDVMPVITNVANRFEEFPAYGFDFDNLTVGAEMAYNDWQPEATWEVKKNKATTVIIKADPSDPNNKVLEINGPSYVLKNTLLPININSADSYAVHQAWEVDLTLPANLSADAEIVLFSAYGEKTKTKDTGIVIKGGKVYYDKQGESVELTGVDLSAGGKITVKREMDFTDYKAVLCDYSIYGADGTLLGQAKDVPVAEIDVPVLGIGLSFKNLDNAVLMDDYKLYVTDVAADFTLYDAKTGMPVAEKDKARAADTAYRLSWLNATQSEKTYQVIAAYYNGDALVSETVVEEVKMAPNDNAVTYGVVENKTEGQTLLVYLKDLSPAEDEDTGSDKTPNKDSENDMTLLIVAAVAFLVLSASALVVTFVLIQAKKKQKAASTKETPAEEIPVEEAPATEETPETDAE